MSDGGVYRDKEWLHDQYTNKSLTAPEIAEKCNCSERTVQRWLNKHNIPTRGGGGGGPAEAADECLRDREWLYSRYITESKTSKEISNMCNCSERTVQRWLNKHNISTRGTKGNTDQPVYKSLRDAAWLREKYLSQDKSTRDIAEQIGCTKDTVRKWLHKHNIPTTDYIKEPNARLKNEAWLREQYVEKGKSGYEIAQQLDCSTTAVYSWIRKHEIETQYNGKVSGEDHWWYSGGEIRYGSGWNETKKQNVRRRDEYTCQDPRCSVTQSEHINKYGKKLHVHHLRKARRVDDPEDRNAKENLITLCRDCHKRWEKVADAGLVPQVVTDG